jgi:hypothetical protein
MSNLARRIGRIGFAATALLIAGTIAAEAKPNNGYSSDPIYCHNQVVNDYYDQVKACEQSLGDDPASLAQCKQDASDDYYRRDAACKSGSAAIKGGLGGVLVNDGNLTVSPGAAGGTKPALHRSLGKGMVFSN